MKVNVRILTLKKSLVNKTLSKEILSVDLCEEVKGEIIQYKRKPRK